MNAVFQKNLNALVQKNSKLANNLQNYIPNEVPQLIQESGTYNLLYKNILVHNKINPLAEAQEIFAMAENTPVAIHLIYGLGLGYLFQVSSINSKGSVILYEPDLNILWTSFSLVDFSKDILKENVYICNDYDSVAEVIYQKSGMKNSPQLLSLPSQREYDIEGFENLLLKLKNLIGSFSLDLKYTQQKIYQNFTTLLENIPNLLKETPLAKFKDIYKGKTAVVVSAGPTLDRNIETLRKHRDKFVLFVVGTAAKTLFNQGIKPDFIVIIESYNSMRQLEGLKLDDVYFITEPYSHQALRDFKFKKTFSHISANSPVNTFWGETIEENIEEYWSKGTVSYTALNCARLLGCSKIILVGQDLAYIEGQCYSKDSGYKDLFCGINPESGRWEIMAKNMYDFGVAICTSDDPKVRELIANKRLKNLNASLHMVKGINGQMIPTESVYAAFVAPLQEYAEHFNDREYINTSLVGAQLDGYLNMSLEEALKQSDPVGEIELTDNFCYNIDKIIVKIEKQVNELKEALPIIQNGKQALKTLNNELKRYKNVNQEVLRALKKVSTIYLSLASDFTNKSTIFDFITIGKRTEIDYEMKMTQNFTVESITNIGEKFSQYLIQAETGINEVDLLIKRIINENFNTKG